MCLNRILLHLSFLHIPSDPIRFGTYVQSKIAIENITGSYFVLLNLRIHTHWTCRVLNFFLLSRGIWISLSLLSASLSGYLSMDQAIHSAMQRDFVQNSAPRSFPSCTDVICTYQSPSRDLEGHDIFFRTCASTRILSLVCSFIAETW